MSNCRPVDGLVRPTHVSDIHEYSYIKLCTVTYKIHSDGGFMVETNHMVKMV